MGLGQVIAELLVDLGKAAVGAVKAGARKALPTTRESAAGTKSDSRKAFEELAARVEADKRKGKP